MRNLSGQSREEEKVISAEPFTNGDSFVAELERAGAAEEEHTKPGCESLLCAAVI